jgi:hypothetical protein
MRTGYNPADMKKSRQRKIPKSKAELFDVYERAVFCKETIATIAELMCDCERAESMNPRTLASVGRIILSEVNKFHDLLQKLERTKFNGSQNLQNASQ